MLKRKEQLMIQKSELVNSRRDTLRGLTKKELLNLNVKDCERTLTADELFYRTKELKEFTKEILICQLINNYANELVTYIENYFNNNEDETELKELNYAHAMQQNFLLATKASEDQETYEELTDQELYEEQLRQDQADEDYYNEFLAASDFYRNHI